MKLCPLFMIMSLAVTMPAMASQGEPLQIVVSLHEQQVQVWRGSELIAQSPVSSGKPGHETPTGIFSVLHKKKYHESNIYSNAPMPWMQRLTWTGIALHEGTLPGRPASHGCVRLPDGFAEELYTMTGAGAHVVINGSLVEPRSVSHPVLPMPSRPAALVVASYDPVPQYGEAAPLISGLEASTGTVVDVKDDKPLRILITRRDRRQAVTEFQAILKKLGHYSGDVDGLVGKATGAAVQSFQSLHGLTPNGTFDPQTQAAIYKTAGLTEPATGRIFVRRNFEPLFDAPIHLRQAELPLGTHLFTATTFDKANGSTGWNVLTLENRLSGYIRAIYNIDKNAGEFVSPLAALDRIVIADDVRQRISDMLTPGSSIAISDTGLGSHTGWRTDFVVTTELPENDG